MAGDATKVMLRRLASLGCSAAFAGWHLGHPAPRGACTVIYYHGVTASQRKRFESQMRWLKSHYSVVPLHSLSQEADRHQVCITFDDGLDNVRRHALPILIDLRVPATLFAVPGNLGREPAWSIASSHPDRHEMLSTAEQLREYPPDLVEIGSHTMTHPDLTSLSGEGLKRELAESKSSLESILKREVTSLSVPFGAYNAETLHVAQQVGYRVVATCDPVMVRPSSPWVVGRFKVSPDDWRLEFRLKAAGAGQWRKSWQQFRAHSIPRSHVSTRPGSVRALQELSR